MRSCALLWRNLCVAVRDAGLLCVLCALLCATVRCCSHLSNMEPTAVAALAAIVAHEHAQTLRSLVLQVEQLTCETQQLAQQALQYRRDVLSMRAVVAAALQNLRRNDLDSVERLLQGCD